MSWSPPEEVAALQWFDWSRVRPSTHRVGPHLCSTSGFIARVAPGSFQGLPVYYAHVSLAGDLDNPLVSMPFDQPALDLAYARRWAENALRWCVFAREHGLSYSLAVG